MIRMHGSCVYVQLEKQVCKTQNTMTWCAALSCWVAGRALTQCAVVKAFPNLAPGPARRTLCIRRCARTHHKPNTTLSPQPHCPAQTHALVVQPTHTQKNQEHPPYPPPQTRDPNLAHTRAPGCCCRSPRPAAARRPRHPRHAHGAHDHDPWWWCHVRVRVLNIKHYSNQVEECEG